MVELDEVLGAIDRRKGNILLFAEAAMLPHAFIAFRKLLLNELGNSGLGKELQVLFAADRKKAR